MTLLISKILFFLNEILYTLYKSISCLVHFSETNFIMLNYPKFIPNDDDFYNDVNSCSVTSPDKFLDEFSKFSVDSYFSILQELQTEFSLISCFPNITFNKFLNYFFNGNMVNKRYRSSFQFGWV